MRKLKKLDEVINELEDALVRLEAEQEDTVTGISYSFLEWEIYNPDKVLFIRGIQAGFPADYELHFLGETEDGYKVILSKPSGLISGWSFVNQERLFPQEERAPRRRRRSARHCVEVEA